MLNNSVQLRISEFSKLYDLIISKKHLLRKIKENIDFSFVNPMLKESYCENFGRPAKEPEMMFKMLFLKKLYDLSDEVLIENIKVNMAYKYFLNLMPEDDAVDSSLLTKFRKTRITEDILEEMLSETVHQAITKGLINSKSIIVDSTHSKSRAKCETPTQILRRYTKVLRKEIYKTQFEASALFPEKPGITSELCEEIEYSKELVKNVKSSVNFNGTENTKKLLKRVEQLLKKDNLAEIQSAADEDAKTGHKSKDDSFYGYKTHIAMTEDRIITAIKVTPGESSDGIQLPELVTKTKNNGITIKEIIGDAAYSSKDNLENAEKQEITVISKLNKIISNGTGNGKKGFIYNKDANTYQCRAGYLAKSHHLTKKKNCSSTMKYYFDIQNCKRCTQKKGCYKKDAKSNSYTITIKNNTHKKQQKLQETEYFKQRAKQRYMIEAKNAELKQAHGLKNSDSVGLLAMQIQSYFTVFAVNIKRIMKLQDIKSM